MKGCRPLTETEIQFVLRYFETVSTSFAHKPCQDRNKAIFLLGISTGLRVGELCGLRIRDVYADGKVVPDIYLEASMTKTKHARAVPLNRDARRAIRSAIKWQEKNFGSISPDKPLFPSEKGVCLKRMGVYFVWIRLLPLVELKVKYLRTLCEKPSLRGCMRLQTVFTPSKKYLGIPV